MRRRKGIGNMLLAVALWPQSSCSINARQSVHSNDHFFFDEYEWGLWWQWCPQQETYRCVSSVLQRFKGSVEYPFFSCFAVPLSDVTCSKEGTFSYILTICFSGHRNFEVILTLIVLYNNASNKYLLSYSSEAVFMGIYRKHEGEIQKWCLIYIIKT